MPDPSGDDGTDLIGRQGEVDLLDSLLDRIPGRGGALLVRGAPGIGKSALLQRTRRRADTLGVLTLATSGVESEAELAFAGLHQLLRPLIERRDRLPDPQRHALEAAFGIGAEVQPDPFRLAVGAFQLVSDAADSSPLVLIVDDAHSLDRPSLGVLAFIACRLESEPVALVAALRSGFQTALEDAGLPVLDLDRLSPRASAELLDREAPDLHPIVRARVLAESAGNPLALVELARTLPATERLDPAPTTLTARLERAFASRLSDLAEKSRLTLLAAALDGRASLQEILRSAALLHPGGLTGAALDPAREAGLVEVLGGEVHFRHPLVRSAVRQAAPPAQVVEMYGALAQVVSDPERRLWHRAMSAVGEDEEIAAALEDHARIARGRGAITVAGAALERAAALTADPGRRGERLMAAAEVAYELGLVEVVRRLLRQAEPLDLGSRDAARRAWLQEMITGNVWVETGATRTFVTIARQLHAGDDVDLALRSLVPIAHRCWWTRTRDTTRQYLVDAATGMGMAEDDPRVLAITALAHPEVAGHTVLRRVSRLRLHDLGDPESAMYVGIAAEKAGDFALGARFLSRAVEGLRDQVRLGSLTQALVHHAWVAAHTGDWDAAAAATAEAAGMARGTDQPQYGLTGELVGALIAALRGTEGDLEPLLAEPERTLLAMKGGPLLATAHLARGAAALGDGRHDDAFRHLWPVFDATDQAFHRFMRWSAVVDLVESGVGSDQAAGLGDVIAGLEAIARRSRSSFHVAEITCARPLLASAGDAEALFTEALAQDLTGLPFLRARTEFSFGRWLRRRRRSADSRTPLRSAIVLFDALGASGWSRRARQELRATGERIGRRVPDLRDRLTAQELQIAQLAVDGLS
ncbi:MAG TPA: AAA family ATPase, partial [Candidatus Dormibacteraeota bacterium]|nr:AAA family ATPase [Candidatus Dormibacteraeota bacterium]